jgi:hypothetical protein
MPHHATKSHHTPASPPFPTSILLIRHPRLQIIILTQRVLQTILALLHMPRLIPAQALHGKIDQTLRTVAWMIARQFPPHGTAKAGVLDVLDFLAGDLRVVVRDHGAGGGVIGPGCYCLRVVEDLGVGLGEGLWGGKVVLVFV